MGDRLRQILKTHFLSFDNFTFYVMFKLWDCKERRIF